MSARETIDFKGISYDLVKFINDIDKSIQSNPKLGSRPMIVIDLSILGNMGNIWQTLDFIYYAIE